MEIKTHFENIRQIIIEELLHAETEIIIAMAWFTNHDIFNILLKKTKEVKIKLIILNDDINNRIGGLDFQRLINKGGIFYYGNQESPMHNKYCIIDDITLITGSYNYTYLAESINQENIIIFKGASEIIDSYKRNFHILTSNKKPISSISEYLENNPFESNVYSYNKYGIKDIYRQTFELKQNGNVYDADKLISLIENESDEIDANQFVIDDVIYTQWKQDYYADRIQVFDGEIIIHYRTISDKGGCYIYGPKANYCWTLRCSKDHLRLCKTHRITNIKLNGKSVVSSSTDEEIIYFSNDEKFDKQTDHGYKLNKEKMPIMKNGEAVPIKYIKTEGKFEITCDIHFNASDMINETIDLIEGIGTDTLENHWHCFDINLKLNRKKL